MRVLDSTSTLGAIVTEPLTGASLEDQRFQDERKRRVDELSLVRDVLVPLCEALLKMHALGVWHLELAPANIVKSSNAEGADLVLLEFGSCAFDGQDFNGLQKNLGTPTPWRAPELLCDGGAPVTCTVSE